MAVQAFAYERVSWVDESMIHDGRLLIVERQASNSLNFELYWMLPPIFRFQPSNFDEHRIEFRHPDSNQRVVWNGERYFTPVRVDIIGGTPYLVIYGRPDTKTEKIYGCPELPYIYLKYLRHDWIPVPVHEAPKELLKGNLSVYDFRSKNGRRFDWKTVERDVDFFQRQSGGQMQAVIPRSYDEWHTSFKNSARNERGSGDCRPPPQPPSDVPLPKPIDIELDVVGSRDYILKYPEDFPDKSKSEVTGTITRGQCAPLFRIADPENILLGELFVNDPTGVKKLPYTGKIPIPTGRMLEKRTERHCNREFVWFIAEHEEPSKTEITKYTVSGEYVYSVRFQNPETATNKMYRSMVFDSLTSENGYFSFYWWQDLPTIQGPPAIYSHRLTQYRFMEPDKPNPSTNSNTVR